ncbi:substrate-binding periplasmic protein [Colwellia sp. MEBiC06753]
MAVEDSWPPYADKQGNGISKQRILAALSGSGISVSFVVVPYARALKMAETGKVDGCFNVTRQHDTEVKYRFGQQPLLQAQASHFYPEHSSVKYRNIADIPNGTRIGLILGYEYGEEYEAHRHRFKEIRVSEQSQIVKLLQKHRIDLAIMFDEVAKFTLHSMSLPPNAISKGAINHISDIYVAFNKDAPSLDKVIEALDEGLRRLNQVKPPIATPLESDVNKNNS